MRLSAIAAMSINRVIGKENQLPWKLPADLKRFREITTGHPVIMGRKTFESIGRILPDRKNIIISRQPGYKVNGACVVQSLESALQFCQGQSEEIFIIGGAEIYRLAIPKIQRLYLTLVRQEVSGDAYFPDFDPNDFIEVGREDHNDPFPYSFIILDRKS